MTGAMIAAADPGSRPAYRAATFADVLRSEWTKLRSVRSWVRSPPWSRSSWARR
jgi:hypothetical protein